VMIEALVDKDLRKDHIRFSVSDSRTDVTPERAPEIVSQLLRSDVGGVTCKELLDDLGTSLVADIDLLGRSTRFYFSLPMNRGDLPTDDEALSRFVSGLKVFLVANDPTPNRIIQYYLRHGGAELEGAPTASETIVVLGREGWQYDVLAVAPPIDDMHPEDIARVIKASALTNLKLLYVAPFRDEENQKAHLRAGFDETIAKPFTKRQLFEVIGRLAGRGTIKPVKTDTILVVEDNAINAQLAGFQLRKIGYGYDLVRNGKEAIEAVSQAEYVAVLMDLQMPEMNGLEATRAIRAREKHEQQKRMPIIALTANAELEREAFSAGCDYFLAKPAKKDDLERAIKHVLGHLQTER
jgi:two-component system sensor histidine kinase/response regulator